MSLLGVLQIIFLALKLGGVVSWSWWIIFLPVIVGVSAPILFTVFYIILICIISTFALVVHLVENMKDKDE